jgi:hypothetical protein
MKIEPLEPKSWVNPTAHFDESGKRRGVAENEEKSPKEHLEPLNLFFFLCL